MHRRKDRCVGILGNVFIAMGTAKETPPNNQENPGTESTLMLLITVCSCRLDSRMCAG